MLMVAPITGAKIYINMLLKSPDNIAGPRDRAGFIDAPVNGPATNEQTVITPPIDNPAINLGTLLSVATLIIVNIRKMLINTSRENPLIKVNLLIISCAINCL